MYVCLCKNITDREIRAAADDGAATVKDLSRHLGLATGCGSCIAMAREVLDTHLSEREAPAGALPVPG